MIPKINDQVNTLPKKKKMKGGCIPLISIYFIKTEITKIKC